MLRRRLLIAACSLVLPAAGAAQANPLEVIRADLRAEAQGLMTAALELSDGEGEAFRPIDREYEVERAKWSDE
jgi:hypothetical protein